MGSMENLNKARQKRVMKHSVKLLEVNPADILPHLRGCLTRRAEQEITCEQNNKGQSAAAVKLFHEVVRYDNWFEYLIPALRAEGYNAIADLLDDPEEIRPNNHIEETGTCRSSSLSQTVGTRRSEVTLETRYRDLPSSVLEALRHLDVASHVYGNNWLGLSGKLGFSVTDVQHLNRQKNPTQALLDEWSKEEGSTLGKLQEALYAIDRIDVCGQLESLFNIPSLAADNTVDKTIPSHSQPHQLKTAASSSKEANPRDSTSQSKPSEPCAKASVKTLEKDLPSNSEAHEPQAPSHVKGVESSGNSRMPDGEKQAFVDGGTPSGDEARLNVDKLETKHVSSKLDGSHDAKGKANKSTGDTVNQTASRDENPKNGKSEGGNRAVQREGNMAVNNLNRTSAGSEMNVTNEQKYDANLTGKTLLSNDRDLATTSCNPLVSSDYFADGMIGSLHSKEHTIKLEISSRSCSTLPSSNTSLAPDPQIQNGNNVLLQRSSHGAPVQQPTETSSHMPDALDVPSIDGTFTKDDLLVAGAYNVYHESTSNQVPKAVQEIQASPSVNTQLDAAQVTIQRLSPSAQSELDQRDHPSHIENQIKGMDHLPAVNKQQGDIATLGATRGGLVNNGATGDVGTVVDPVEPVGACKGTGISADVDVGATGGEGFGIGTDTVEAGKACKGSSSFTGAPVGAAGGKVVDNRVGVEIVNVVSSGAGPSEGADFGSVGDTPNDSCAYVETVGNVGASEGASSFDDVCKGERAGGTSAGSGPVEDTANDSCAGVRAIGNVGASEGASLFDDVGKGDRARSGGFKGIGSGLAGTIGNVVSSIDNVAEGGEAGGAGAGSGPVGDTANDTCAGDNVGASEGARSFDDVPDGDRAAGPDVGAAPAPQGRGALFGTVALAVPVVLSLAALAIKGGVLDIL